MKKKLRLIILTVLCLCLTDAITIDPVKDGFAEYETQMNAVQTILANTQKEGTNVETVNKALDELNTYADKTIYNFTEMTRNIGTFTAAGVKLDASVSAIKGIANLAAVSGSTSQQASTAMYQLSQALAAGKVQLMDWNSVVNAGMGGQVFQDALIRTSEHLQTGAKAAIEAQGSFRESLQDEWLTTDVLTQTLDQFATAADTQEEYNAAIQKFVDQGYTQEQAKEMADMAKTAGDAATKVKTFTQLIDTLKEALGSGWTKTWQLIVGDFEEAKEVWTKVSDVLGGFINKASDARNAIVEAAMGNPYSDLAKNIQKVTDATSDYKDIVDSVIRGNYGNGQPRFDKLASEGYDWARVQNLVNERLGCSFRYTEELTTSQEDLNKEQEKTIESILKMSDAELKKNGLTSYGVSSTLDSLMVGGRNLFKHSSLVGEKLVCDSINGCNSIDTMKYEDSGYHIVTPNAGNRDNGIQFKFNDISTLGLKKGDTITFSIDVKGTSDEHNPFLKIWLPKEKIDVWWEGTSSNMAEFVPTKEFKRASVTFTIPSSYELPYILFGVHGNIQSDLYIRNVKLEKGTVATDWTPAPEDFKKRISDVETAISNNAKEIKLKASQDEVTTISDNLKVLTKTSTEFKQTVEGWQLNWDKLISTDNAEVASHQDYITFDKGDIILGESSNDLKLKITNDSIQFKGTSNTEVTPDSDATAWITGKTFHISDGEIQNSLKFGKLYLKPNNENNSVDLYYSDSESDVISGSYVRLGQTISMGNGMGSGFLKLNTGCIQMYPTTLADTIGNGNTGKFELHAGGSYPYIIFGDYNTNDEAKKEKGRYSVRIGGSNTVSGNCSVAIGYSSDVSGKNSTAIGHYLKNISDNQLLIGKYNISSDYPFIIGNGSSDTERSNALTVDWDGNITGKSLTSANDLKLGFGSSNIFKPYFTKGDSITLTIYAVGYVTTGGKEVAMYVPLSRPIIAGGSVSVASVNGLTIRQNGKYLYSSSASNSVNPSSFRAAIVGSGCGVNIVATFGNTVNATVNDVCSITASIKITFS